MVRFGLSTLFTLLAASAWCGQKEDLLAKKISYENPGASVEVLLKSLATKTGLPLEASPRTAKEIVAVRVQGVATSELLGKIAEVVGGSWKQEKVALRLVQSDDDLRAEQQREREWLVSRIEPELAKRRLELKKSPELDSSAATKLIEEAAAPLKGKKQSVESGERYELLEQLSAKAPINRTMKRLVAALRPEDYADIPLGYFKTLSKKLLKNSLQVLT